MKKLSKRQRLIILVALVTIVVIIGLILGANVIKTNITNGKYNSANNNSSSSNLLPEYIKEGVTLGGVTGTLVDLDTSDATATAEDIIAGKIAYVRGEKIVGTRGAVLDNQSYAGNYADINNDGIVDGVIFADLAVGGSGEYASNGFGYYEIATGKNLKSYYIVNNNYTDKDFKINGKVITTVDGTSGNDRFYVMALKDINPGTYYCWYDDAAGKLDNIVEVAENDFGKGREYTEYTNGKWTNGSWGAHNANNTYDDIWGVIQDEIKNGWFVPSKSEWAAFGDTFDITSTNYSSTYGLSYRYWASSIHNESRVYAAGFDRSRITNDDVTSNYYVRLATTF